jgi:NADP-dependent aldehyde dehydrogenase
MAHIMTQTNIPQICTQALDAFGIYKAINRKKRYDFLHNIIKNLLLSQENIITQAQLETYLPLVDLTHEFERTIFQIQHYAQTLLEQHIFVSSNHLSLENEPIGCVAVFGASNFPLAYSTIGGDVVSALVAGCSVIFKAHEAHKETSKLVADAIQNAISESGMPQYVYQHIQNISHTEAALLVQNPVIKAVGFTGSLAVGRYLFDLCQVRPEPIPFFGELGAVNPVFMCNHIFEKNYQNIALEYSEAFTKRGGQLCVNPAVLIVPKLSITTDFYRILSGYLQKTPPQRMLTDNISCKFVETYEYRKENYPSITDGCAVGDNQALSPVLFAISIDDWLGDATLHNEVFGMMGVIIEYETDDDLYKIAESFSGQLTASIHGNISDTHTMHALETILSPKVGRLVFNQYPTSVAVDDNMHHGGVYPASTCSQFTAVGKRAINRFLRPVCYQNKPYFLQNYLNKHDFCISQSVDEQAIKLANIVAKKLSDAVLHNGHASLAVSGGKSPIVFLNALSHKNLKWDNITVSLVDERCVHTDSNDSNEKLVRDNLLINHAKMARFVGLYNTQSISNAVTDLNTSTDIPEKFDCIVLGMGDDGHFASVFPNSDNVQNGLYDEEFKYSTQTAPTEPTHRISMNMPFIAKADLICLAIAGDNKLKILDSVLNGDENDYPIGYLLKKVKINIFYVE